MTNIRYADNTVLIAKTADDPQRLLDVVVSESDRKGGLSIDCSKTECMLVSRKDSPRCVLKVKDENTKQVDRAASLPLTLSASRRLREELP